MTFVLVCETAAKWSFCVCTRVAEVSASCFLSCPISSSRVFHSARSTYSFRLLITLDRRSTSALNWSLCVRMVDRSEVISRSRLRAFSRFILTTSMFRNSAFNVSVFVCASARVLEISLCILLTSASWSLTAFACLACSSRSNFSSASRVATLLLATASFCDSVCNSASKAATSVECFTLSFSVFRLRALYFSSTSCCSSDTFLLTRAAEPRSTL
mmetsp:Transcript_14414/g.28137  ORF Transcript_14414/g.28137 Transcript_14414/m.28137 type:complete len:215 (+) Transcript_14414:1456-2100(+)